ncbi:homoprotocatechuate degradation operon regulator HpaR [Paroceanicella profunda]|uniref:Homoprotocatechuate degradation operon regulator HpaR n=1 Tax=Paroceanicella profunda TaxID=2579971 RepID=A0A5B8FUZ2_9RHOB|nr:homoprotocatechuate degradation operon regulator HpaR [Paroceanicella profunda]QDL92596.1 homoprotocatechuate degradation operon regulator HpaR [Paroceanicella profunda]
MSGHSRQFERALPIALLRAREATMRLFKPHVDAHGLSLPQWRVMRALAEMGPLDATELSERCAILGPSLTRILRALEDRGFTAPSGEPSRDARRRVVVLTQEGAALFHSMVPESERIYRELEAEFGSERLETLLTLLEDLREAATRLRPRED